MFIEWNNEKHSLGIPTIDNQHRELFRMTNEVHQLLINGNDRNKAIKVLKRLYAYTGYHFTSEESIQKEYGYPGLSGHAKIHGHFKKRIKEELEGMRDKGNSPLSPLQDFLVEWILKHIQGEDTKYARFFRESGINPELHFSVSEQNRTDVLDQWKIRQLELEIREIDNQHRELIAILQQTNDLQYTGIKRKKIYIPVIIRKLFYYSQYHFSYEEEHMAQGGYEKLKSHQDLHRDFIRKIREFAEKYNRGTEELTDEIILFLKDWTINHIIQEDRDYKDFLLYRKN